MRNVYAFNIDLKQRNRVIAVVMIGAFVGVLNQTLMTTILPEIMKDFTVSSSTAQWLTTIFMLVNGIMIPITAFLIERFTLRSLFFYATCFLMIGSFICMLGINFPMLLVGRSIQALGAGILMPLTQTLLFIMFPPEKRGMAMGMFGLVIGFAPAIGPTAAGWFVNIFDWRYLFLVVLLIGMVDFVFGYLSLPNITELSKPNLDKLSVILSTVSFGGLLYGFSTAGNLGWSHPMVYITIIAAIVIFTVFIFRQLKLESPLLEFRVFKYNDFSVAMILIVLMFMLFIGNLTILPIYMQTMMKWSPLESGLILLPGGLIMGLLSPVTGKLFDKIGGRILSIMGMLTIMIGALLMAQFSQNTTQLYVIISFSVTMLGNAMIMTPMTTQALNALPRHYIAHGTAMNNTIRQVSAAIGTGILVTLMTGLGKTSSLSGSQGLIHGLDITFYVVALIAFIGTIIAFFIRKH
ncbi:DHA2 family efflux MFS transporter permease subunit [Staphylococcus aureus]|uniref:DHA2 family efflux MFS transporter permease subunit n=1 Tax=Staphylococcus aureus TaxID=1280 RepID=UPI000F5FDA86|nr:DHA2 family efflux MFS transporter permease subunit [Staphylococcus aureus]MCJ8109237.1 DHA2 family efflux MFS transporter permease subunit [Staphylococcus aureus]MDQ1784847.1 DHA2 family efflux MFS transporter permease subunit [Staphylococcus aureus]MDQ1881581.1 DHA2 family efflux MFS transporter permease subunit [Staphylococcus aureus]QHK51266.1 DHA2 family efflux MFS transporter permease subunit [Staphylococcus aureus]RQX54345.1 DHA2 family efflux MFS transporter permease subunit [Staphy